MHPNKTSPADIPPTRSGGSALDRFFRITERGSTYGREVRGGFATFFTMAYILVLNPIILGGAKDKFGDQLDTVQLVTATALVAAVMTLIMGVGGNLPLALAAGLGINAVVAYQVAPLMAWDEAMGLIVLEGLLICVFVATGLREAIMHAIPQALKQAISVGIGLFIAFIGFVDAGFVTRIPDAANTTVPVQLGSGTLTGWPMLVFCLGVIMTIVLLARKVKGAILISIVVMTIVSVIINSLADVKSWGLTVPSMPDKPVAAPDFGLLGQFDLFGSFGQISVLTVILLIFTLILSDFFDTMGTVVGVTAEAGLLDERGQVPGLGRVLLIDGAAAVMRRCRLRVVGHHLRRVGRRCRRGRPHRLRQPDHGRHVRPGPLLLARPDHRAHAGRVTRTGRGRVPDDDPGQAHRLGPLRPRHPGVPHDHRHAVHVLHHQRHRRRLRQLRHHQGVPGQGP